MWKKIPWAETRMEYGVKVVKRGFAVGQQLEAWRFILLTNWMGDDGFLWEIRRPNPQIRDGRRYHLGKRQSHQEIYR